MNEPNTHKPLKSQDWHFFLFIMWAIQTAAASAATLQDGLGG